MQLQHTGIGVVIALFVLSGSVVSAQDLPQPHQTIRRSADQVLTLSRGIVDSDSVTDEDVQRLLDTLDQVVAFDRISEAVIGDHLSQLNGRQTEHFADTFRLAMTRFYLESLVNFDLESIEVVPPQNFKESQQQATVRVRAVDSSGEVYGLDYFLRQVDEGNWLIFNMIIDGVNLGISYRSQFDSALSTYGDVDTVITNWQKQVAQ